MGTIWKDKLDNLLKSSKQKIDEGYERIKEDQKKQIEVKALLEKKKDEELRKQKIKEDRRRRQDERRRLRREAVNSKIMLFAKILCLVIVVIWACWFTTDFVYNYDTWIAKYHKWSIEYEFQAPARAEAKVNYDEKKRLEGLIEESRRSEERRRNEIAQREVDQRSHESVTNSNKEDMYRGKSEAQAARDLSNVYDGLNMNDPNFDLSGYCIEQERKTVVTYRECMGAALLKATQLGIK